MMCIVDLNGEWQLRWEDGERGERLANIPEAHARLERAWTARVPGSVHEALLAAGVIADPNIGTNVLACRWVEEMLWHYRRTFVAEALAPGERAWLIFEALDLAAVIRLNGVEVGRHANVFHPCRVEVTAQLRPGANTLLVTVESGLFHAMHRSADGLAVRVGSQLTKRPWLRKPQSSHGWDWAPRLLNVGIPGNVRLEIAQTARWDNCVILADVSDDLAEGRVTGRVFVEGLGAEPLERRLSLTVAGQTRTETVTLKPGMNRLEISLAVPRPDLWWPIGHGAQPRYKVEVALDGVGWAARQVGFRHVRVNQSPHPRKGTYFIIEVNHKPIFCKGGNFVPADTILSRIDRARYATLVDRAIEASVNLLRVWGGGVYESDEFYDLCDERGVLVWQEFIFACAKYPATDEKFLADVKCEATHQVRRLAHHPSLILWCGNNEMEWGNQGWGYEHGVAHPDYAIFHMVLPRILKQEDGGRYYHPSSPFSPDHELPNADHTGDQHPWSVGFGETDFRKYRDMSCRFPNEGGLLGPTALPTVLACTDKIGSFAWDVHENSVAFWEGMDYAPDRMIETWTGRPVGKMSIADYVYWGGLVQGAGLAEYILNFRRRMFDSASAIFWMYNDVWPCVRSWTVVDYYLRRTPAFWPVRRAFAPVALAITREEGRVRVHGVNEGAACRGTLRFGVLALAGGYPEDQTRAVELPANASTVLAEFDAAGWDALGIDAHVAFATLAVAGREAARATLILPLFREMRWPPAQVRVQWKDGKATFTSDTFAWRVCLDLDGERALPDNFFDVYPGLPTVLDWPEALGAPQILRIGNGAM
jgi:beta-mannosidase